MELLLMCGANPLPMTLPLLPPMGQGAAKPAALKSTSLSRLDELNQYMLQCDDANNVKNYIKAVSAVPRDVLDQLIRLAKARSAQLSLEEQREYRRAKKLKLLGNPLYPSPGGTAGGNDGACSGGSMAFCADADAFCSQVLEGNGGGGSGALLAAEAAATVAAAAAACGGGSGNGGAGSGACRQEEVAAYDFTGGDMQLERLEMFDTHHFLTPADLQKTKMRVLPLPGMQQGATGGDGSGGSCGGYAGAAGAAAGPGSSGGQTGMPGEASPAELAAANLATAGMTDHQLSRISPDGQPAATPVQPQQQHGGKASGRARQLTLHDGKL